MGAIFFMLPLAVLLGGLFAALFLRAVGEGQFDDLDDPPLRMLQEREGAEERRPRSGQGQKTMEPD